MQNNSITAPIYDALLRYRDQQAVRFHVPGHKGGAFFPEEALGVYASIMDIDLTELDGLDDLHEPRGIIARAQELAAACFGADYTFFLVNGSTAGNLAMVLGTLAKGDQVLVQRNSHQSIFHALALAEAEVVLLEPHICTPFAVPAGVDLEEVQQALRYYPHARALILTNPNYYGMAMPIRELIDYAHEHDLVTLVDEAHGAHFGQHALLPASAMQSGADISVQSTHKMLGSMTMTSMLHLQGDRVNVGDIQYFLQSLQSSSPSYPLLASLDLARAHLDGLEDGHWRNTYRWYTQLREEIASRSEFIVSSVQESKYVAGNVEMDPFKLVLQSQQGLSGYELQRVLQNDFQIYCELADLYNVVLTLPLNVQHEWNARLVEALVAIDHQPEESGRPFGRVQNASSNQNRVRHLAFADQGLGNVAAGPVQSQPMRIYRSHETQSIPLLSAMGRIAAQMLIPYPPGIPVIIPGELITKEMIEYIFNVKKMGAAIHGIGEDQKIQVLK